jgi:hypothetical protein
MKNVGILPAHDVSESLNLLLRMRSSEHVARMEEMRNACKLLSGNLKGKDHSENIGFDGRIILEWISGK